MKHVFSYKYLYLFTNSCFAWSNVTLKPTCIIILTYSFFFSTIYILAIKKDRKYYLVSYTLTSFLSLPLFSYLTYPDIVANKVSSVPLLTFLPG